MSTQHDLKTSSLTLRIDWSDQDVYHHVNNVAILRFVQSARVHFWETTATLLRREPDGVGPTLASTRCRFVLPFHYPGSVRVITDVTFIKTTSFGLAHRLYRDDSALAAEADDIIVMYDYGAAHAVPIAADHRIHLKRFCSADAREGGAAENRAY